MNSLATTTVARSLRLRAVSRARVATESLCALANRTVADDERDSHISTLGAVNPRRHALQCDTSTISTTVPSMAVKQSSERSFPLSWRCGPRVRRQLRLINQSRLRAVLRGSGARSTVRTYRHIPRPALLRRSTARTSVREPRHAIAGTPRNQAGVAHPHAL